ncbi:hypothetical protein LBMAG13_09520 [Actinomycetes bacterium]|nr:hypothetical protein LBMAG13_09520 [Actinomycetes bacterium]
MSSPDTVVDVAGNVVVAIGVSDWRETVTIPITIPKIAKVTREERHCAHHDTCTAGVNESWSCGGKASFGEFTALKRYQRERLQTERTY